MTASEIEWPGSRAPGQPGPVRWVVETEPEAYARRVLPWLERDPVERNLLCTIVAAVRDGALPDAGARPLLAWLDRGDGEVAAAAVRTPPYPVVLPALSDGALTALVERLAADGTEPSGVSGPAETAAAFAAAWSERSGVRAEPGLRLRLHRLEVLRAPEGVPGAARVAAADDADLVAGWMVAFAEEAGVPVASDPEALARRRIASGWLHLWDVDGMPTCMVDSKPPVSGVVRIGPVYTPPEHRRRGYGAVTTAAACRRILDAGAAACVLYADLANPTSNGVYHRIGFRPLSYHGEWLFNSR